ncbi:MAG: response regulator [Caulobacterales bacterium]|nr:response regulator [Caulobacterales bacterium]
MSIELSDLDVIVATDREGERHAMLTALRASGVRHLRCTTSIDESLAVAAVAKPDVMIMGLALQRRPTIDLLKAVRRYDGQVNRYLPIIVAQATPSHKVVQMALNCGAHEFLALPTNVKTITALIERAVFVGRPFVEAATYFGPCRRRREKTDYIHPDRRRNPWQGYVHAANSMEQSEQPQIVVL